ncbi:MAG: 30S ribosomal protein S7 [Chloroherpetonaceae bacterium]|nr:30S ribosomal protein S7 [Chloroherpetonaceae bacterium]MCS7210908.1 30S ribosomal protein S7 [Chloroherpetonaceae bacterium]MDW8018994.1 30S ribosomal protein S7 [Chloroherpetonaceae bacterium]MDW8464911.1 30S ribosomal protein S7 [Chloroherpetonaceae bacterium]
MRKKRAVKRPAQPDAKYGDPVVGRFINVIMQRGKKNLARRIVYGAFDIITQKTQEPGVEVFKKAISNVAPVVEVRGKRIGGATYQIPMEVRADRRIALALRWMKEFAKKRSGRTMSEKLAAELIDAANNQGGAVKKKEEVHKMAEANKAFSHFRF